MNRFALLLVSSFLAGTTFTNAPLSMVAAEDEDLPEDFFDHCMHHAADIDVIKEMIEADPELVNKYSEEGETCLMLTAIEHNLELAQLLIEKGADINSRALHEDNHRMPVIGWHALSGSSDIVRLLIEKGVDINAEFDGVDENGDKFGIFTVLDLMDFVITAPDRMDDPPDMDDEVEDMLNHYKDTREELVAAGAKKFVGSEEM